MAVIGGDVVTLSCFGGLVAGLLLDASFVTALLGVDLLPFGFAFSSMLAAARFVRSESSCWDCGGPHAAHIYAAVLDPTYFAATLSFGLLCFSFALILAQAFSVVAGILLYLFLSAFRRFDFNGCLPIPRDKIQLLRREFSIFALFSVTTPSRNKHLSRTRT